MTQTTTITSYKLKVKGFVWAGFKASYEYAISADKLPRTLADAKRIAGDFETLTSAKLVKAKRVVNLTEETTVLR